MTMTHVTTSHRADPPAQQAGGLFCAAESAWGKPV